MWAYAMPVYVLFVSSRSGIVLNPSAGAITDHSQSAKDIDPYFKSQLYVEDSVPALYLYRSQLKQVEHGVTNLLRSLKTLVGESMQ